MTVLTITLGHDGLRVDIQEARFTLTDALSTAGEILATFLDGVGSWDDTTTATTVTETCDAWILAVPEDAVSDLRGLLSALARTFGQTALGCIIHDSAHGPSFCTAAQ